MKENERQNALIRELINNERDRQMENINWNAAQAESTYLKSMDSYWSINC